METIVISKGKIGDILSDVERLVSHVESLVEDQDTIVKQRISDIDSNQIKGKSEEDLDKYLRERGVKVD